MSTKAKPLIPQVFCKTKQAASTPVLAEALVRWYRTYVRHVVPAGDLDSLGGSGSTRLAMRLVQEDWRSMPRAAGWQPPVLPTFFAF